MVGRDIGSVVMPDAPFKVYLVASLEERARRRAADAQARGLHVGQAEIRADIERRDALDSHVMNPAPDAMIVSTDGLSPEQVVDLIVGHFPVR
jgi:cytidylate kinase